jgi:molybdate transport system ATP-binding protein
VVLEAAVDKQFGEFSLELRVSVPTSETLVVVGESGAGKSTLLRLVAGLERPDRGRVAVDAAVYFDASTDTDLPPWRRRIGYVAQSSALFPHLTVFENVAFGLRAAGVARRDVGGRVEHALVRLDVAELAARQPDEISGGQAQRVALARALVLDPDVLLLDEPLSSLDLRTRQAVRGELKALLATLPCATIYVTHDPLEAMVFGDRIAALEGGRVTQNGTREDLLARPRSPYVAAFLGINMFRGRIVSRGGGMVRIGTGAGELSAIDPGEGDEQVTAVVHPREIALFREPPGGSAQNMYVGVITELVPEPPNGERVRVTLATHPPLVAEVTDRAVVQLALREGQEIYAMFKATGVTVFR